MKIAIASDKAGFELKEKILSHLSRRGIEYFDLGLLDPDGYAPFYTGCDAVCRKVQSGDAQWGLLVCGTGAGMCMLANKYDGIRALVCESVYSARMCRVINNANVLTLGGNIVGPAMAFEMVDVFIDTAFVEGMTPDRADYLKKLMNDYMEFLKK